MKKAGLLLAFAAALCACAQEPVRYAPTTLPPQLPVGRLPKLLLEDVSNEVGVGDVDVNHGQVVQQVSQQVEWADIVRDALAVELGRMGWPLTESRASAGARLHATLKRARAEMQLPGFSVDVKETVVIDVVLKNAVGAPVWEADLTGVGHGKAAGGGWESGSNAAASKALTAAIARLGHLLADERPWEKLGGPVAAPVAQERPAAAAAPSDIDQLPQPVPPRPKTYALAIGIERYRAKLPNADFASSDARLAAEYFKRVLGVPERNVAVLTDEFAAKADLEKYIERWLPNQVEEGATVYVFYSGHGAPDPAKGDAYLVPYDSDPTYIEQTGYSLKRLYDQLAKLPAKQVFVAMDSCFSGAGGRSVLAAGARPLVQLRAATVPAKVTVISASAGDQISSSYADKGHGLFTYFFLKGLRDNRGDLRAAFDFAEPQVARFARQDRNADQTPQWKEGR